METIISIDWSDLESLLSEEDKKLYKSLHGDAAREFLITNPRLDPTTARNLRVHYLLMKAVEERRITDISLHDTLFHQPGEIMMKESKTEADEKRITEPNTKLDALWKKADPSNSSHRLAMMYARRR